MYRPIGDGDKKVNVQTQEFLQAAPSDRLTLPRFLSIPPHFLNFPHGARLFIIKID